MADTSPVGEFFNRIDVVDCHGLTKTRVGGPNDGGYILLDEIYENTDRVLTLGVGDDVSFELDSTNRFPGIERYTLCDPTIFKLPVAHEKFTHLRKYAHQIYPEIFLDHNGHSLLKCDIECWEWEFLSKINEKDLDRFSQILIELHIFHVEYNGNGKSPYFHMIYEEYIENLNVDIFKKYNKVLDKLLSNFYIFHIHANNSLPLTTFDAWTFPPLLELSLVRKDLVNDTSQTKTTFPSQIDRPNKTDRPDIEDYYPIVGWRNNGLQRSTSST